MILKLGELGNELSDDAINWRAISEIDSVRAIDQLSRKLTDARLKRDKWGQKNDSVDTAEKFEMGALFLPTQELS